MKKTCVVPAIVKGRGKEREKQFSDRAAAFSKSLDASTGFSTPAMSSQLPASFKSLYRLLLRTSSASVLHHSQATKNLRVLYRPTFEEAAKVIHQIQKTENSVEREALKSWVDSWDQRIDNTLALLYSSCRSRGLPHQLTRNLSLLLNSRRVAQIKKLHKEWSPTKKYPKDGPKSEVKALKQRREVKELDEKANRALNTVLEIAEGRDALLIGRSGFGFKA